MWQETLRVIGLSIRQDGLDCTDSGQVYTFPAVYVSKCGDRWAVLFSLIILIDNDPFSTCWDARKGNISCHKTLAWCVTGFFNGNRWKIP